MQGPDLKRREPTPPKRREAAVPVPVHAAPKPTTTVDEDSTMRDQLSKAWKRIADLETRIHDLTLQATMVSVRSLIIRLISSWLWRM